MIAQRLFSQRTFNLVRELVVTDFKLRYQGSVFGYLWSLAKPMMLFSVLYVVFTRFFRIGDSVPHYPAYLLLGIVLWTFFVESTQMGMRSIAERGDLIRKVSIPKYTIVLSASFSAFINLLLNLIVVAAVAVLTGVPLRPTALLLPLVLLELLVFSVAVSFMLSAMFVKFRDVGHIWDVVLQVMFYATPILYPVSFVPDAFFRKVLLLSPLAQIIQDARFAVVTEEAETAWDLLPGAWMSVPLVILAVAVVVSSAYFKHGSRNFAENL